jgi:tetratricopeptide (TPR) repeat protein
MTAANTGDSNLTTRLAAAGYWVAQAARAVEEGKYSTAVRLCREMLPDANEIVSARLLYGAALFKAGQSESAADQFHRVLALDPDNLVALKCLGDIRFAEGDQYAAMSCYRRILEIDPFCRGLCCTVRTAAVGVTRTVTLKSPASAHAQGPSPNLRPIPFYTETMGDLYLAQGYSRLATAVYQHLLGKNDNPRLAEKLARAEGKTREKEPS